MWVFESPGSLGWFLLFPVLIYLRHIRAGRGGQVTAPIQLWRGASFRPRLWGTRTWYAVCVVAFWLGIAALVVAAAAPTLVHRERVFLSPGSDIIFVLDESPTMAAQDFAPLNRFETAREVIRTFVRGRENDAIGLVTFAREAALRVPPTVDHTTVLDALESVRIMELGDGTAIGNALAVAVLHLESSPAPNRFIVLLTDGINNAGEILPQTAARVAAQVGIRVYTVGVGTDGEVPIEFEDPATGRMFRGVFDGGYDPDLLREIADISGGTFFQAATAGTLAAALQSVDTLESVERRVRIEVRRRPLHREAILVGLSLLLFDFLVRKWLLKEVL
ncbi:MAG: VWA domain-containing protein [Spirochaetaceae bacterium]|nr:MAG: VWA domain-containing protein [Spirochaetaceae bacterium]